MAGQAKNMRLLITVVLIVFTPKIVSQCNFPYTVPGRAILALRHGRTAEAFQVEEMGYIRKRKTRGA